MAPNALTHPRFHFDRDRRAVAPPSRRALGDWAVSVLVGPHGGDTRECIQAACALRARTGDHQVAVRDVAGIAAAALRGVAAEIHDIGREFGFDPTSHPDTSEACGSLVLVRVAADFPEGGIAEDIARDLAVIAADLSRSVRLTAEACALRELMRGMIARGEARSDALVVVADDAQPETLAILPDMWRALGGGGTAG